MKSYYLLFFSMLLFIFSCTEKIEEDLSGYVYGTITSASGNAPVAGVIVQCNWVTYTTGTRL